MVGLARERLSGRAEFFRANLEDTWDRLDDASFDLALSALAMDYVRDWSGPLSAFLRVLGPGGRLVFSVEHPASTFVRHVYSGDGNYFETEAGRTLPAGRPRSVREALPDARVPLLRCRACLTLRSDAYREGAQVPGHKDSAVSIRRYARVLSEAQQMAAGRICGYGFQAFW